MPNNNMPNKGNIKEFLGRTKEFLARTRIRRIIGIVGITGVTGVITYRIYPQIAADLLKIIKWPIKNGIKVGMGPIKDVGVEGGRTIGFPGGF